MKRQLSFITQSTSVRVIEVDVADNASEQDIKDAACLAMEKDEDVYNEKGAWKTVYVESGTIRLETGGVQVAVAPAVRNDASLADLYGAGPTV